MKIFRCRLVTTSVPANTCEATAGNVLSRLLLAFFDTSFSDTPATPPKKKKPNTLMVNYFLKGGVGHCCRVPPG